MDHQTEIIQRLREVIVETRVLLKKSYDVIVLSACDNPLAKNFVETNGKAVENLINEFTEKPVQTIPQNSGET